MCAPSTLLLVLSFVTVALTSNNYPTYLYNQQFGRLMHRTERENDPYPWWRVSFPQEVYVTEVEIFSNFPNDSYVLHDLEIRVGNNDVSGSNHQRPFDSNSLCYFQAGVIRHKHFTIGCKSNLVGKVVSIQVTKPCVPKEGCSKKNVMNLCEVIVRGFEKKNFQGDTFNLRRNAKTTQSSVVLGGNSSLAIDGVSATNFYQEQTKTLCAAVHVHIDEHYEDYEINLNGMFIVSHVGYDTTNNIPDKYTVQIFVENERVNDLREKGREPSNLCNSDSHFVGRLTGIKRGCRGTPMGKFVIIRVKRECSKGCPNLMSIGELKNCYFDITGRQVPNVAFGKNAWQNNVYDGGVAPLANDGLISDTYLVGGYPACAHTAADGQNPYPWWRVDLTSDHFIDSLILYNRKEYLHHRLHDVVIKVGSEDIRDDHLAANMVQTRPFPENHVCKNLAYKVLQPGANYVTCDHPMIGRYVSIQITNLCLWKECKEHKVNMLTLCEVEVYGFPIDKYFRGDAALGKTLLKGTMAEDYAWKDALAKIKDLAFINQYVRQRDVNWWQINLGEVHAVESVKIFTGQDKSTKVPVEVLVGFANFQDLQALRYEPFRSAMMCAGENVTLGGSIFIHCGDFIVGKYLTVVSPGPCKWPPCPNIPNALTVKGMQVWAIKFRKNIKSKYAPINWSEGHALVANGEVQKLYNYVRTAQCTHTASNDKYPWWEADLYDNVVVYGVVISKPGDLKAQLHDLEIRFGAATPRPAKDQRLKENSICAYREKLPSEAKVTIPCQNPLVGRYLTIQIVRPCNSDFCDFHPYNVLSLCEVDIVGHSIPLLESHDKVNLALRQPMVLQSSTGFGRTPELAVDGKFQ